MSIFLPLSAVLVLLCSNVAAFMSVFVVRTYCLTQVAPCYSNKYYETYLIHFFTTIVKGSMQ